MSESGGTTTPNDEAFGGVTDQLEKDLLALLSSPLDSAPGDSIEYSDSAEVDDAGAGTAFQWEMKAREAYDSLSEVVSGVKQTADLLGGSVSLRMPSLFEMVSETIRLNIESNEPIKTLSQLTEEREAMLGQSDLPSFKLRSAFEGTGKANLDALKAMRFQLPQTNLVESPPAGYSEGPQQAVVSIQIYRKLGSREIKILAADFSLSQTLLEMFRFIVNLFPESRMWDGPLLSASGLVIIGDDMYTTGPEDYANSYSVWLNQFGLSHTIQPMESVKLGELTCVGGGETSCCCFIQFCGSEILKLFFSNLSFAPSAPRITYKRKLPRPIKCVLCRTRAANLVIVNDVMLPLNPSHCCNSCYRRLRSDGNGNFLMPPETVVVSEYCTI